MMELSSLANKEYIKVKLGDTEIMYQVSLSGRIRRARISIDHSGEVIVTVPKWMSSIDVASIVKEKSKWIVDTVSRISKRPRRISLGEGDRDDYENYKELARSIVQSRLQHYNEIYHVTWNNVSIKNTKSRWGSCSKMGNLNFSYKLALLPIELVDYVVVHEMCHLKELNHGHNFWNLVRIAIPNYLLLRKKLREYM